MDFEYAQKEIDSIQTILEVAKTSAALGPNDPAVIELERILIRKVGELEAAKTEARDAILFEKVLFAPNDSEDTEESLFSSTYAVRAR